MALRIVEGPLSVELDVDEKTHRVYKIRHRIESTDPGHAASAVGFGFSMNEGPDAVLDTPGLPEAGDLWAVVVEQGGYEWAYCLPNAKVMKDPQISDGPSQFWIVEQTFTTKPVERKIVLLRGDPFLDDPVYSGGTIKFSEEAVYDRNGKRITNSSLELIRGPQNEWDMGRPSFRIEQQVVNLNQALVESMMNCVNDAPLWGLPARCIKLCDWSWKELYHRFTPFYSRSLMFEGWTRKDHPSDPISSGWDRNILDEGTKVLRGRWQNFGTAAVPVWQWVLIGNPNRNNPGDFVRFKDTNGNLTRVILDGAGSPYTPTAGSTVTTCTQCPSGAPSVWDVGGFPPVEAGLNGTLLDYVNGCTWSKTVTGTYGQSIVVQLTNNGVDGWRLTVTNMKRFASDAPNAVQTWSRADADWQCLGANSMSGSLTNASYVNKTMMVTPAVSNSPGTIHVERYPQANFLELGIPAILGG